MQLKASAAASTSAFGSLLEQRRAARHGAEQALARANASRREAALAVEKITHALEQHRASRPAVSSVVGEVSALALQRSAAFARRHVDRSARLSERLTQALRALADTEAALEQAQRELALASAGERAIERHEADRAGALDRQRERREQEALDEEAAARIFAREGSAL